MGEFLNNKYFNLFLRQERERRPFSERKRKTDKKCIKFIANNRKNVYTSFFNQIFMSSSILTYTYTLYKYVIFY